MSGDHNCNMEGPHSNTLTNPRLDQTPSRVPESSGHQRQVSFLSWARGGSPNSSKNSSGTFCRICHDGELSERFISPCQCTGSVGLVHRSCIEKWLSTANHDNCEICGHKYSISKHPRPFVQWICEPSGQDDQRNLIGDIICFMLLTPLATISAYLCATGAQAYLKDKWSEAVGLICLSVFLVLIYLFWVLLTVRYHWQIWSLWQDNNQDIRLVETARPVIHRPPSAETVISEVDMGSGDTSINMAAEPDTQGSQSSINSATELLNDKINSYFQSSDQVTPTVYRRESLSTQMSAPLEHIYTNNTTLETPNDGSFINDSIDNISTYEDTVIRYPRESTSSQISPCNPELTFVSIHDSSLLGIASSCDSFTTAESILQEGPIAASTPGNVDANRKRSISTSTYQRNPPRHILNPPNQYLHPINSFIPQRTASQPNLADSEFYTQLPPSPDKHKKHSSKHLEQITTPIPRSDSIHEYETLPPYPVLDLDTLTGLSLDSLPLPNPILDNSGQSSPSLDNSISPRLSSDSDALSNPILENVVTSKQLEVFDLPSTPFLGKDKPPNPPLSPNITIESPKHVFGKVIPNSTEIPPTKTHAQQSLAQHLSFAGKPTPSEMNSPLEDVEKFRPGLDDENKLTRFLDEVTMPVSKSESALLTLRLQRGGTEV